MTLTEEQSLLNNVIIFFYETYMYIHKNSGIIYTEWLKMITSESECMALFIFDFLLP